MSPDDQASSTLDAFLRASTLLGRAPVPAPVKEHFLSTSLGRYELFYRNSPKRHGCPYCRQLVNRHGQEWPEFRAYLTDLRTKLLATDHPVIMQVVADLQQVLEIGDAFCTDSTTL